MTHFHRVALEPFELYGQRLLVGERGFVFGAVRVGDALDLLLKRLIELPESRDRILNSTVRHFVRREGLCQEFGSGYQQFLVARRSLGIGEHPVESLMMQGSDFYEALFLGDGTAPQLVGAAQSGLATTLGVFSKR